MKKLLAIFLTAVMLVLSVASAIPVFAADGPFVVGETNYATLTEAVANASANDTIYLTADYTTTDDVNITVDKALTIKSTEGNKFTITVNATEGADKRWINSTANLTIENINLTLNQGIGATGNELTIKNSDVNMTIAYGSKNETRGAFSFLRIDGAKVTLSGTTVAYNSPNVANDGNGVMAHPIYIRGTESTFILENNSSVKTTSKARLHTNSNSVIFVDYADGSSNSKQLTVNITVGEGCTLSNETVANDSAIRPVQVVMVRGTTTASSPVATVNVTLKNGSVLNVDSVIVGNTSGPTYSGWLVGYGGNATCFNVVDQGCTYLVKSGVKKTNAGSVNDGNKFLFPTISNAAEGACFYTNDGIQVLNSAYYQLISNTAYEFKFGTYIPLENAFKVGSNTYEKLSEAIAAANAGDTIYVQRDVFTSETDLTVDKALTIKSVDGQKYTVTITAAAAENARWISSSANLTIEDINVITTQGISATGGTLTLKNVTANQTITISGAGKTTGHFPLL